MKKKKVGRGCFEGKSIGEKRGFINCVAWVFDFLWDMQCLAFSLGPVTDDSFSLGILPVCL